MEEIRKMSTVEEPSLLESLSISSLVLAELMDVEHRFLTRNIESKLEMMVGDEDFEVVNGYFAESTYMDSYGRSYKSYNITRKGCDVLANKMQGKKGMKFTVAYVEKFYIMEQELKTKQIDGYKALGEKAIANLKFDVSNLKNENEYLKDTIEANNKHFENTSGLKDRRIADLEAQLAKYKGVQLDVTVKGREEIPAPVKTVEPILIEVKEEKKKTKKSEGKKERVARLLREYDFTVPPHDNPMKSDKHLPDGVFDLSVTHVCNRGNWGLKPADMNVLLEAFGLQVPIGNNERRLVEKYEGLGYGRTVRTNKSDYQSFYGLRWSEAGFKYIGKIINMNKNVLDIFK